MKERYKVVRDLQGGEFAMLRDYTVDQWKKQALEWCYMDENYGVAKELYKLKRKYVLDYIAEFWAIEFRKVRKDKKISNIDLHEFEEETLKQFYDNRFKGE